MIKCYLISAVLGIAVLTIDVLRTADLMCKITTLVFYLTKFLHHIETSNFFGAYLVRQAKYSSFRSLKMNGSNIGQFLSIKFNKTMVNGHQIQIGFEDTSTFGSISQIHQVTVLTGLLSRLRLYKIVGLIFLMYYVPVACFDASKKQVRPRT